MACKNSKIDHKKLAADLRLLASRFETTANALLVGAPSRPAIGDARDHMTEAGRALLKLVISGFLAQPSTVPPWLKLSIRSDSRRPKFVGSRIQTDIGVIEELDYKGATLAQVLEREFRESAAARKHETHRASDLRLGNVRRRLVFLEAATGWLADRFHVKPRIHPSMCSLLVRDATGRSRIDLCFDWLDEEDSGTSRFFMSVCRNGSRICSGLASMLDEAGEESAASKQPEQGRFADAMARYDRSCDEMRTVRLTPGKVIPVDQWPEETQVRGSAIVRAQDWNRYVRYVLQVADENEHRAKQARLWWTWWEATEVDPTKTGPAPLVPRDMEQALLIAASRRTVEHEARRRGAANESTAPHGRERPAGAVNRIVPPEVDAEQLGQAKSGQRANKEQKSRPDPKAIDRAAAGILKDALQAALDAGEKYVPTRKNITESVSRALNHRLAVETLFGTKPGADGRVDRYPEFMKLWKLVQDTSNLAREQCLRGRSTKGIAQSAMRGKGQRRR